MQTDGVCAVFRGVHKLLVATGQLMVDVGTADGHTPLHVAAVNGLRQIAQLLVETVSQRVVTYSQWNAILNKEQSYPGSD